MIMGVLAWVGLLTTAIGFVIAFLQLRKVQSATQAASDAVARITTIVRSQERSTRLHLASDALKSADEQLRRANGDAAAAYLIAGWQALLDARELTEHGGDRDALDDHVVIVRRLYDEVRSPFEPIVPGAPRVREQIDRLSSVLNRLGVMASELRASLSGIGAVKK